MLEATQAGRLLSVRVSSLGEDVLLLAGFDGGEEISSPFSFDLELLSQKPEQVSLEKIVGRNATVTLQLQDGSERFFNGFVSRFALGGRDRGGDERFTQYRARLVPWLWFLTQSAGCRIHQDKTVPEIVKQTFERLGFRDFRDDLTRTYTRWDYCVQYRETDFQFVSRLLEQEGIFYFFEHEEGKHTLVLADSPRAHKPCPGQRRATFSPEGGFGESEDTVTAWQAEQELRPGRQTLRDYHFEMPAKTLEVSENTRFPAGGNERFEVYDYPGGYAQKFNKPGERLSSVEQEGGAAARLRMEEREESHLVHRGESFCRGFAAGAHFELLSPPPGVGGGPYVLTSVRHSARRAAEFVTGGDGAGVVYSNAFTCIPQQTPFRPPRVTPKPTMPGPQTAVVVGPPGEEILVDKYGRVKVQFRWDREGRHNEQSSCWVRVAQGWAGRQWGAMFTPRVGHEVIVSFLEGDPDRPLVTGGVYNAQNMPHYSLPDFKTLSYVRSDSTKGGGGFNELRFEDKQGGEQVFVHAQRRMDVRALGALYETNHADRHAVIGLPGGTEPGGNFNVTVGGDNNIHIKGGRYEGVEGKLNLSVGGDVVYDFRAGHATVVGGKAELNATEVTIEALAKIVLKVGPNFIMVEPTGITIHGPLIKTLGVVTPGPFVKELATSLNLKTGDPVIEDPLDAETSDTGEPGYLDRPAAPGGVRKPRPLMSKHLGA